MLCAAHQAGSVNSCHVPESPSVSAELELLKGSTLLTHRGCNLKGIYFWGWPHIIPVYATDTSTVVEVRPGDIFVVSQNNCSDRENLSFACHVVNQFSQSKTDVHIPEMVVESPKSVYASHLLAPRALVQLACQARNSASRLKWNLQASIGAAEL